MADLSRRGILKSLSAIIAAGVGAGIYSSAVNNEVSATPTANENLYRCGVCHGHMKPYVNYVELQWRKYTKSQAAWNRTFTASALSKQRFHVDCAKKVGIKTIYLA